MSVSQDLGKVSVAVKGAWSASATYEALDIVTNGGGSYISKKAVPAGTALTNTEYWIQIAEKGDAGTTSWSGITDKPTTLSGYGVETEVDNKVAVKYTKPTDGIPKTDLASAVQTSLGKADTAVQQETGKGLSTNDFTDALKAKLESDVEIVTVTAIGTTMSQMAATITEINEDDRHVLFDLSAFGINMFLCTVFFDDSENPTVYKIVDIVKGTVAEGEYNASETMAQAMARQSAFATQEQINYLQKEIDELQGGTIGSDIYVNSITGITATSSGACTITVSDAYLMAKVLGAVSADSFFLVWNGTNWLYNDTAITPQGITINGTPVVGEVLTLKMTYTQVPFTVVDHNPTASNPTAPVDTSVTDYYIVEQKYIPDSCVFDAPESAICVTPGYTLAANKYFIYNVAGATGDYWCNYKRLYYCFEILHDITATDETGDIYIPYSSRGSRETTGDARGVYQLYGKPTYANTGALYNSDTVEFVGQVEAPSSEYTDLRTVTGFTTDQTMTSVGIIYNNLGHMCYGNNEYDVSNISQRMNSDAKSITPVRKHKNDVVTALSGTKGFMYGLDPRFFDIVLTAKYYMVHCLSDEFTQNALYSAESKAFLLSMKEMGFNTQTTEGDVTDLYNEYVGGTLTNSAIASRAKSDRAGISPANYRWSRSGGSGGSSSAREVSPTGAYGSSYADGGYRFAPAYIVKRASIN